MIYSIALFLHITGALMLFASISIEWLCVINMRNSTVVETIKESIFNYSRLTAINLTAMILILIPGIYMMAVVWKNASWISIAFIGIILLAVVGGAVTGRKMKIIKKIMSKENNISPLLRSLLNDNSLMLSIKMRTTISLGIIFLMAVKPDMIGSIVTLVTSVIIGFLPLKTKTRTSEVMEAGRKVDQEY